MRAAVELAGLGDAELEGRLEESRRELFNLRFQLATGQLDNPSRMSTVRKDVARILTILREREISEADAIAAADALESGPIYATPTRRSAKAEAPAAETEAAATDEADEADEAGPDEADGAGPDDDEEES